MSKKLEQLQEASIAFVEKWFPMKQSCPESTSNKDVFAVMVSIQTGCMVELEELYAELPPVGTWCTLISGSTREGKPVALIVNPTSYMAINVRVALDNEICGAELMSFIHAISHQGITEFVECTRMLMDTARSITRWTVSDENVLCNSIILGSQQPNFVRTLKTDRGR